MKNYIVLQNIVTFRTDWRNIANPQEYNLYLILGPQGKSNLRADQRACFTQVLEVEDFAFDTLCGACESLFEKHSNSPAEDFRLLTNDEYYLGMAAALREKYSVPGARYEEVRPFTNKLAMKQKMQLAGIPLPKVVAFDPKCYRQASNDYIEKIIVTCGFPIFAKPVDSAGSEGTCFIPDRRALQEWCERHQEHTNFELDEFIQGSLFHVDSIIINGQITEANVCAYSVPNAEFLNGKALGSVTLSKDNEMYARLVDFNEDVLAGMGVVPDGATHLEVFLTQDDRLVFLEIAARAPGGMVPQMYAASKGQNIEEQHFLAQMGLPQPASKEEPSFAAWVWFPQIEGVKVSQHHTVEIDASYQLTWQLQTGDVMAAPNSIRDRVADILLWHPLEQTIHRDFQWLLRNFKV